MRPYFLRDDIDGIVVRDDDFTDAESLFLIETELKDSMSQDEAEQGT